MKVEVFEQKQEMAEAAARYAAGIIRETVESSGHARILLATGGSQFEFLAALTALPNLPWDRVEAFHLDEYIGLRADHPAGFRRYLMDRVVNKTGLGRFHPIDGLAAPAEVCRRLGEAIRAAPIDLAFVGIGENGHLAFNDPPANIETRDAYLVVSLDEACRRQQVGEGWFKSVAEVPRHAITISIPQLLKARRILAVVPDARKAAAIRLALEGPISVNVPSSFLRNHDCCRLYLDRESAALLRPELIAAGQVE